MSPSVNDDVAWMCAMKADRLLCSLPAEQIAYLGDDFPWAVTDHDVMIARARFTGPRLAAIEIGRRIAALADAA